MTEIKDLLLQILLIIVPIFIYHMFYAEKLKFDQRRRSWFHSFLNGLAIILCMSFPVAIGVESLFDLRGIPLLIGILYGGYETGAVLSLIIIAYRFYLGVDVGFYHTVISLFFIVPVFMAFYRLYQQADRTTRRNCTVLLSVYHVIVISVVYFMLSVFTFDNAMSLFIFNIVFILASCFLVYMNENLRENNRMRSELQKTEKLRVLSDLTSAFAHEIRNPMQVNRGFLQLMHEEPLPPHLKNYVEICLKEMDRANLIISDYLSFAKPHTEDIEMIDVGKQLEQVQNILAPYALMQHVEIQRDIDGPCLIMANQQKLNQCLINLVKNGIEAMPNGGVLMMSCQARNNGKVTIHITDQGVGMTKDQIKRLGTPFYTLKEKGTGLGLMVSYRIIQTFNGSIQVSSELSRGTTFSIEFPSVEPIALKHTS